MKKNIRNTILTVVTLLALALLFACPIVMILRPAIRMYIMVPWVISYLWIVAFIFVNIFFRKKVRK